MDSGAPRVDLDRLLEATRSDPEIHAWLDQALQRYRAGEPLERALGLAGPEATKQRNAALRRAADLLDPPGALSAWQRAKRLEETLRRFEAIARHRSLKSLSLLQQTLAHILQLERAHGVRAVRCQRALFEVIRD